MRVAEAVAAFTTLYLIVSFSLPPCISDVVLLSLNDSSGRSFFTCIVFSSDVPTVSEGQVVAGGVKVAQVTPVTVSVAKTFRFLGVSQAITALVFCTILIPIPKNCPFFIPAGISITNSLALAKVRSSLCFLTGLAQSAPGDLVRLCK